MYLPSILLLAPVGALVDTTWQLQLSIGRIGASSALPEGWVELQAPDGRPYFAHTTTRETTWTRPREATATAGLLGPPLAMFTPGGGRAERPSWFPADWAASGEQLGVPLEVEFFADDYGPTSDEPLVRTQARKLYTRSGSSEELGVKTRGVCWGMVELSSIEALLVWTIDLPDGARSGDVGLDEGTRLFCSTQVWKGDELERLRALQQELRAELQRALVAERTRTAGDALEDGVVVLKERADARRRLEERIWKLESGMPRAGAPTVEVPGPWPGTVTISTHGQVAVQRVAPSNKLLNPFENGGRVSSLNPFAKVAQFGVVGSFVLAAAPDRSALLESEVTPEVEVIVD